jgi:hypothetical protein
MNYKKSQISEDYDARKKDIYLLKYDYRALKPSHMTDYMDYNGPWPQDIERILFNIEDTISEQGTFLTTPVKSRSRVRPGLYIEWYTGSYHILNCILEQDIHMALNGTMCYSLSIMGRQNQADNLYLILHNDFSNRNIFKAKPEIKRYENKEDLRAENFNSVSDLECKLKLIATMEKVKGKKETSWNWLE